MVMSYVDLLVTTTTILQISDNPGSTAFSALLPRFIERAETLIYADPELDFQFCRGVDSSAITSTGSRAVALPPEFMVVEGCSLITPANAFGYQPGAQRIPLLRVDRAFLDMAYPNESFIQAPDPVNGGYYAIFSQLEASPAAGSADEPTPLPSTILVAPTPDNSYHLEVTGTARPAPLSQINTTTPLTTYYPTLFLAAVMVIATGYQRDWGAQTDDPRIAMSWKAEYDTQRMAAIAESARMKSWGPEWSARGFRPFGGGGGPPPGPPLPAQLGAPAPPVPPE